MFLFLDCPKLALPRAFFYGICDILYILPPGRNRRLDTHHHIAKAKATPHAMRYNLLRQRCLVASPRLVFVGAVTAFFRRMGGKKLNILLRINYNKTAKKELTIQKGRALFLVQKSNFLPRRGVRKFISKQDIIVAYFFLKRDDFLFKKNGRTKCANFTFPTL